MRRTPVMVMAALALVPVTIWTMSGSASAASGSLTVTTYSRTGAKVTTALSVYNVASNAYYPATSGKAKTLPKGTYVVLASIPTAKDSSDTLGARVLKVSGKTATTIDARSGKALKVSLDKSPAGKYNQTLQARICARDSVAYSPETWNNAGQVFVIPNSSKYLRFGYVAKWEPSEWEGSQVPPTYAVAGGASGSIPSKLSHTWTKSRLAPVSVSVRRGPSIGTDVNTQLNSASGNGCLAGLGGMLRQDAPPYSAKIYASAGAWSLDASTMAVEKDQYPTLGYWGKTLKLTAGQAVSQTLFRSAWGPADNLPYVHNKRLSFDTGAMFTDPGFGWNGAYGSESAAKSTVTLSIGGKVVTKKTTTGGFGHKLPRKGWYTLNVYAGRYRPGIKFPADLMSHKANLWLNFYANPKSAKQPPLILPRLAPLGLDARNTAKKGSTTPVDILLEQQRQSDDVAYTKATPKTVTARASFDFGKTWKSVTVKKTGSKYQASVKNTKSGLVGLRVRVVTTAGTTAEVTIYRAYRAG